MCNAACTTIASLQDKLTDSILSNRYPRTGPVRDEVSVALSHLALAHSAAHRDCLVQR